MHVKLFDFQQEAVKRAINSFYQLLCVRVGGGKTLIAMCYSKILLKKKLVDKVVFACTVSAAVAVHGEYLEKLNLDLPTYTTAEDFLKFLDNDSEHICIIKHSLFEKLGYNQDIIDAIRDICETKSLRNALIIDEAHKLSNDTGIAHTAYMNIKFMFERILLMTATPYSSCLSQLYGVIHLINPKLWKSRAEFFRRYIEEMVIMQGGKVRRKEKIAYKNLKELRERITPFTFFYYPKIHLNFIDHKVVLKDYTEYDELCKGVLTINELERVEKGEKNGK